MSGRSTDIASAYRATAVTPANGTAIPITRALYIGAAGDVAVILAGDAAAVTFSGVPVGTVLPVQVKEVRSTGTTATLILALY